MSDATKKYDLLFKNVKIVRPGQNDVPALDIGVKDGKILAVEAGIAAEQAVEVVDGGNKLAFPGLVDPHMHCGIYGPLDQDARSESLAAALSRLDCVRRVFEPRADDF